MKKKLSALGALLATLLLLLCVCGCSSFVGIKAAYINEGYTIRTEAGEFEAMIEEALGDDYGEVCRVHIFTKTPEGPAGALGSAVAIVLEFGNAEEMNAQIEASAPLKELVGEARTSDYVNGNCVLLLAVGEGAKEIFTKTK